MIDKDSIAAARYPRPALLDGLDLARLPRHVAVIMDGNGRWARQRRLPRVEGHRAGIASVRATVETAARLELDGPHPLRLLDRELEASAPRGRDADGAAQGVPAGAS